MRSIRPTELANELLLNIQANIPVMVWGPPGVGKSDIVKQVCKSRDMTRIDFRANLMEPVDLRGIPFVSEEGTNRAKTIWAVPDMFPNVERDGPYGVLNLEEVPAAMPSMQTALYQLCLDRRVGDYVLPDGWRIIATGNQLTDGGNTYTMPTPLKNRFAHYLLEPHTDDFLRYALQNSWDDRITGFINFRPGLLHQFDKDNEAFPTPRTWEILNRRLKHVGHDQGSRYYAAASIIGDGAAGEFVAFCEYRDQIPDIDMIVDNPETAPIPAHEPSMMYAVASALAAHADEDNFGAIVTYCERMNSEYQVVLMKDASRRNAALLHTQVFSDWADKNASAILD